MIVIGVDYPSVLDALESNRASTEQTLVYEIELIAISVHRWQSHLLDEGAIARVSMEKVESGVRLSH
jgi:hypothetical protein